MLSLHAANLSLSPLSGISSHFFPTNGFLLSGASVNITFFSYSPVLSTAARNPTSSRADALALSVLAKSSSASPNSARMSPSLDSLKCVRHCFSFGFRFNSPEGPT